MYPVTCFSLRQGTLQKWLGKKKDFKLSCCKSAWYFSMSDSDKEIFLFKLVWKPVKLGEALIKSDKGVTTAAAVLKLFQGVLIENILEYDRKVHTGVSSSTLGHLEFYSPS